MVEEFSWPVASGSSSEDAKAGFAAMVSGGIFIMTSLFGVHNGHGDLILQIDDATLIN